MKKLRVREDPLVRNNRADTGTRVFLDPLALSHGTRLEPGGRLGHSLAFLGLLE